MERCAAFREALSARLDGEDEPIDAALTDAHLRRCADCRAWHADAVTATRLFRVQQVPAQPAGVDDLLAALDAHGVLPAADVPPAPASGTASGLRRRLASRIRGRIGRAHVVLALRVLLGGFGAAQFMLGIAQVTTAATASDLHGDGAGHLWHESAAWNVAIGAGFGWIASRRGRPAGALPMLTAFVGLLALLSVNDLLAGRVETERLLSHAFVLAGYAIVIALTRPALDPGFFDGGSSTSGPVDSSGGSSGGPGGASGGPGGASGGPGARGGAAPRRPLRIVPGQATAHVTDREAA
ncbi:zf-HC2 domain-containing protein [Dactylosporangium sp. NPDC049742]|uniref:zf-HC2 domain-containing protein n=1 Tax=Dactylosporangium sp. NPDC049742 TaxID=3154737 RepID=UPI00341ABE8F